MKQKETTTFEVELHKTVHLVYSNEIRLATVTHFKNIKVLPFQVNGCNNNGLPTKSCVSMDEALKYIRKEFDV